MIEVKNRMPTYPGRVKMTPVAGAANTFDMVRADEPLEEGTPINAVLFESIRNDVVALQANVSDLIISHAQKTLLASVVPGTEFALYEDGIRVPFIKLSGEYEGTGRTLVVRKHSYKMDTLTEYGSPPTYMNSKTDLWLNDEADGYIAKFDDVTKAALMEVPIKVHVGDAVTSVATLQRKAFLLSAADYGFNDATTFFQESTPVAYFNTSARRVAQFNGAAANHWIRTRERSVTRSNGYIVAAGYYETTDPSSGVFGIRPAFTLPSDFEIDLNVANTANVNATAEVI
jgi:hypothetical protein